MHVQVLTSLFNTTEVRDWELIRLLVELVFSDAPIEVHILIEVVHWPCPALSDLIWFDLSGPKCVLPVASILLQPRISYTALEFQWAAVSLCWLVKATFCLAVLCVLFVLTMTWWSQTVCYGTSWLIHKDVLSSVIPASLRRDWLFIFGHLTYIYSIFANITTDYVYI